MGGRRIRTDLKPADFFLLSRFAYALNVLRQKNGYCITWQLGEQELRLPLWKKNEKDIWEFHKLKDFRIEAVAIKSRDFRRVCKYLKVVESQLLGLLFKAGVLAVNFNVDSDETRRIYLCQFSAVDPLSVTGASIYSKGYILVRERAECVWKNTVGRKSALQVLAGL